VVESQAVILVHISRRTDMSMARKRISQVAGDTLAQKVFFLMDYKGNRERYEAQLAAAEGRKPATPAPSAAAASESGESEGD
jgi:hypothetical protein